MIQIRKSDDRGHFDHGWLDTYHTFSFADYYDPQHMGFGHLRVINEDRVEAGEGFGTHGHRDMEIVTYVYEGELEHKDSMGNGSLIKVGDVQYMSAGKGVTHSEFNPSKKDPVRLLQIWIMPDEKGAKPRYDQKNFNDSEKKGKLRLIVSKDGTDGSIAIRQNAKIYASKLDPNQRLEKAFETGEKVWIQVVKGDLDVSGQAQKISLKSGDGAAVSAESALQLAATKDGCEFLLFIV